MPLLPMWQDWMNDKLRFENEFFIQHHGRKDQCLLFNMCWQLSFDLWAVIRWGWKITGSSAFHGNMWTEVGTNQCDGTEIFILEVVISVMTPWINSPKTHWINGQNQNFEAFDWILEYGPLPLVCTFCKQYSFLFVFLCLFNKATVYF